jgi:hypothetical protein
VGYSGAKLAPMFSPAPARVTARRMAGRGAEHFRQRVADSTPVDDSPRPKRTPGTARAAWRVKPVLGPVVTRSAEVYETGIESWDPITLLLEYGTGRYGPRHRPYVIRGDRLRFYSRRLGRWVFARDVLNPGQRPQRPLATGAALTEAELAAVLQVDLQAWRAMVEAIARA